MAFCNRPKGSTARAVLLACAVAGFGFCLVAGPAWSPARGDVDLLVDGEGTFVADSQPNDSDSTIAESGRAGPLLNQIRRALTGGDSDRVLYLLEQLHKMGPEVVIRETGRGVHQSLGDMVYGFPAEMRKKWADFVGPHAEAALDLAHRAGGADGYVRVVRSFPGTPAARRAAGQLYGLAFENGRFRRTVELVRALLADPGLTAERRRTALLVLAISAVEVGDRPSVAEALERLKKLGRGKPVPLLGSDVEAIAFVEKLSKRRPEIEPLWLNVGGAFTRNRLADSEPTFEGLLVMGGTDSLGASTWASGVLPARKQLLEKQERKVSAGWTEGPVLVTERSFIAGRGSRLVAYDRLSGDRLWQLSLSPEGLMNVMTSWPSAADGKVATVASWYRSVDQRPFGRLQARRPGYLMRTERKKLVVLSEETGQEIWSWDGSLPMPSDPETGQASPGADLQPADDPADRLGLEPAGSPLVYGGRVFVGAVHKQHRQILVNCFVMCFEASNGRLLWQRFIGSGAVASLPQGGDATKRMVPTTDGRRLYVESAVGTLAAIDLATADLVWVRKFARPSAPNRMGLIPASWPSGLGDAPIVVGSRLLVSDISSPQFQTQLRCFDTATGRDLWKGVEMQPGQRLGVAQGMLLVSSGRSLYGYDVADGQRRLLVGLPGGAQVTGRGFLTAGAAYVPTDAGIFRIDLKERKATLAYARQEGTEPSLALTPVGGGVVSNHPDQLRVFGRIDEYFERVRRGIAAHPDDPVWTRRLAELCRQGNDFSKAELLLQLAADQAGQLGDLERRRDQKLATNRRLARLYKQWGRHLLDGGKPAEAVSKLEAAVRHSTGQAAGVRTLMTLARYYESQGDKLQASSCYARVADREAAERFFLPADSDGLEQTPATQARLALRRLSARRKTSPAGLGREWIKRLSLRRIGMLTWSTPSQVAVDSGEPFTPLVWVRTDGLVGLGPAGEIRWRRSKPPEAGDSPAMPLLSKGLAYQSHDWGLVAYRLNSGRRAWTWSVPKGRITASGARAGRLLPRRNFQRIVRINGNRLLIRESVAGEAASSAIAFTDRVTVVGTYDQRGDAPQLHGLDPATGRQKWKLELPQNTVVTHLAAEGGKVVAAMQKRRGPVELRCIDADSGQQLWQAKAEIPLAMSTRGLFMMNGVVVLLDFAKGCRVISGESGKTLWQADLGQNGWPGAAPIYADRERTVLRFDRGCVAVSNSTGKAIWQIGSASAAGEALIVRSAISSATWTEALAFGDRIVTWRRGDTEDLIVAYRIKDGQVAWQHEAGGRSQNGYGLTVCRDMLIYHEVGEIGFRRALGDATKERRLKFLDLAGGKLLGEIFLGAGPAISMGQPPLEVHLTPGGLYVQNGNEMLSVRPSAGAGAATGLSSPPAVGGKI